MNIGVNTRFLLRRKMEGFGWYTFETISRIVRNHPEHHFFFFFDRKYDKQFLFSKNITPIVLKPQARHPILFKIWFDYAIPRALKKYKCDAFISPDGYVSMRTKTPQLAVIHDLNFEHNPTDIPKNILKYLRNNFPKFADKATRISTVSNYSKNDIIDTYNINSQKIDVSYNGASEKFGPINQEQKNIIRLKYTRGKKYILFVGALHKRKNINRLIESFSMLKERTDFEHQLLIVGEKLWNNSFFKIPEKIKEHVHFTGHTHKDELTNIMSTAELLTFVSYFEGFGIPIVEAMKAGTPVLSGNLTALPEVGGDAVHYCNPLDTMDIYEQLKYLLSQPDVLENLKNKGLERSKMFTWDNTAKNLWMSFEKMMAQEQETGL